MMDDDSSPFAPGVDEINDALNSALAAAQTAHGLFPASIQVDAQPTPVVVGVSGGVDSVCLLHALQRVASRWGLALHVAHLDHALRPDSANEAGFVADLAQTSGLPLHLHRLPTGVLHGQPGGLEATARRARYNFLCATAINVTPAGKVPLVAVAHHADDQAETLLLHLLRGSGLQGLGAMRPETTISYHGRMVRLLRPLLAVRRPTIEAYARLHELPWREDETNQQTQFLRNRLRHHIVPCLADVNPNVSETLARTADLLAADFDRLAQLDRALLADLRVSDEAVGQRVVMDLVRVLALDLSAQRGVIRLALTELAPSQAEFGFTHVERLLTTVRRTAAAGGPHPIGAGLAWSVAGATSTQPARLSIHLERALPFAPTHPFLDERWRATSGAVQLPQQGELQTPSGWRLAVVRQTIGAMTALDALCRQPWAAVLDADAVGEPVLTTPRAGLRIAPLGMSGHHKSVGDLFTDCKTPAALRPGWPLIVDARDGRVLWVCGLAVSHAARLTPATRDVLALSWVKSVAPPVMDHPP